MEEEVEAGPTWTWRLANGLQIELGVHDLEQADLAVCSTDEFGNDGALNLEVLRRAGIAVELASSFHPPVTRLEGTPPVLVVQTVESGTRTAEILTRNLRAAASQIERVQTVWLPLLGTGDGRLSPVDSARLMLDVLGELERGRLEYVLLAAPNLWTASEVAEQIAPPEPPASASPASTGRPLSLAHSERQVQSALVAARRLAGNAAVAPRDVVAAIVALADKLPSPAFDQFRALVAIEPDLQVAVPEAADADLAEVMLDDGLWWQLQYAQRPVEGTAPRRLWGRDLVVAALLAEDDQLAGRLAAAGVAIDDLRDAWFRWVCQDGSGRTPAEWTAWWRWAGVALPDERGSAQAGYAADTDQGQDQLGIEGEARALARLILDENVDPPLSIGLLGDWGSGKSFFIEQLKQQIDAIQGGPGLHGKVVQIEFNAWHVSDSNLWASLVTYLFDEIWNKVAPRDQAVGGEAEERRVADKRRKLAEEIGHVEGALHEADAQVKLAEAAVRTAEDAHAHDLETLALRNVAGAHTITALKAAAERAGWKLPLDNLLEAERAARDLATSGARLRAQVGLALSEAPRQFLVPALVVAAAAAGLWMLASLPSVDGWLRDLGRSFASIAGTVGGLIAAALGPLRSARGRLDAFTDQLEKVRQEYEEKRKAGSKEIREIEEARRNLATAEASVAAARKRLAELRTEHTALDPARRLAAFLQERVQSTQYRAQQGIISLVRRDFEQLSARMRAWRKTRRETASPDGSASEPPEGIVPVDRIVLYIDDLDRCSPEHVVHALEAVHLLLALDLFVVVVAVDSRWLIQALEVYYKDLLEPDRVEHATTSRRSTARNYLEKIFQITYALPPMDPSKFGGYIDALTAGPRGVPETPHASPSIAAAPPQAPSPGPGANLPAVTTSGTTTDIAASPTTQPRAKRAPIAPPRAVRFDDDERTLLKQLAPLLPTPRAAKRLVNVYRLLKASRPDVVATEAQRGPVLLLLAVLFGRPAVAAELFRGLHERGAPFDRYDEALAAALRRHADRKAAPERTDWELLLRDLESLRGLDVTIEQCRAVPELVARYSLVTGHEWHVWHARAAESPQLATAARDQSRPHGVSQRKSRGA